MQSYPSVYDRFLSDVSTKFERVLVIMGNHEYYRSDVKQARSTLASICAKYPNVTLLLSQSTVIDNIRFGKGFLLFLLPPTLLLTNKQTNTQDCWMHTVD